MSQKTSSHRITLVLTICFLTLLPGCSTIGGFFQSSAPEDMNLSLPPETLVKRGMAEYNRGKYFTAIEYFDKVLASHRFSPQAIFAELKIADCKYYMGYYIEAYEYYEQFEEMHPTNEAIPYVMYQKGMCHYKRIDTIDRDITGAQKAIERFQLLLKAYPDSPYTEDARQKIAAATEFLANHEYEVARFYLRVDKPAQAIIRLRYLAAVYPEAKITPRAQQLLRKLEAKNE
ncbi:MAG: outer membrane protein assembly factor BamD [Desulfopila sp.]